MSRTIKIFLELFGISLGTFYIVENEF